MPRRPLFYNHKDNPDCHSTGSGPSIKKKDKAMKLLQITGKMLSAFLLPIRRNATFFIFMYILGLVCSYAIVPDNGKSHAYELTWEELFFDLYAVAAVLAMIPRKVRPWIRGVLYAVLYMLAIVDLYCYVKFDSTLNPTMLLLVGETNTTEATEFLASYLGWNILFSSVGYVLLIIVLNIIIGTQYKDLLHVMRWILWHTDERLNRITAYTKVKEAASRICRKSAAVKPFLRPAAGLVVIITFIVCGNMAWENKILYARLMSYENIGDVEHELTKHPRAVQYQPIYRFAFSIYANELTAKQLVRLKESLNDVKVDSCSFRSRNIVLIIGESYNRNHASFYGYPTPNTPRQKKLKKKGELITFTDVVSPWNLTSFVFKHIFSLYTVGDKGDWCDYPLFPEIFRKAGYHVTFMTNQFLPQAKEAVYDFSGGFFLNDEVLSKAQFDTRNTTLYRFDNGLLCNYEKLKDEGKDKPQLIIFHLKGQHVEYRMRCPKVQKRFDKDYYKETRPDLNDKERTVLSDYDNAVLYNDSIVTAIIDKFRKQDAIVIYVPDHGEEIYDGAHFYGRMHSTDVTARLAHAEFEIPMWVWASRKYRRSHPDIWRQVRASRKRPYMTDAMPYMLMYLAGIECPQYRDELNVLGDKYNAKRPRILKHQADYDELMRKEKEEAAKKEAAAKKNSSGQVSSKKKTNKRNKK